MITSDDARLTAEALLASSRGCALVFGLASRQLGDSHSEIPDEEESSSGASTLRQVAERLRQIDPVASTQDELEDEMAEVIGSAMYWQPPEGNHVVFSDPWIRAALLPFAAKLIATGLLDDWAQPVDTDSQWALAWDDSEVRGVEPAVFGETPGPVGEQTAITIDDLHAVGEGSGIRMPHGLDEWLAHMLTMETERRHEFAQNPALEVSSEWWSTPPDGHWASTATWPDGTPIGVELVEDDFGLERARACRLLIEPAARICEIHRPEDWGALCRRYPLDVTAQRRYDWFETTGRKGRWVIPDWTQVAEEFDGVHVSLAGYLRTAGDVVDVGDRSLVEDSASMPTHGNTDERTASLIAGWSPDTTYWLNDVITRVAEVVDWILDDESDEWVRG